MRYVFESVVEVPMRIHHQSVFSLFLLIGCQGMGEEAQELSAHRSGGGGSQSALLEIVADIEIESLFCSSPNLEARRPQFECEGQDAIDDDSDSDSDSDRNRRHRRPSVVVDAMVDEVDFIALQLSTKARKRNGGWVSVGTEILVMDPIFAMNGLSLQAIPLGSGMVRTGRYDRIKIMVDGVAVHFRGGRASETFTPNVRSIEHTHVNVTSSGASAGVDLNLTVRFADDSDSDQIAFWFNN
jgi:hypothetical protein